MHGAVDEAEDTEIAFPIARNKERYLFLFLTDFLKPVSGLLDRFIARYGEGSSSFEHLLYFLLALGNISHVLSCLCQCRDAKVVTY